MAILELFRRSDRNKSILPSGQSSDHISNASQVSLKSEKSTNTLKLGKSFSWKPRSNSSSQSSSNTDTSSNDSSNDDGGPITNTLDRPEKGVPSWLKKKKNKKNKNIDPREKPLNATNLRHQEMLSHFTWTFGNRRDSLSDIIYADVSPGCSRLPSIDGGSRPMPRREASSDGQSSRLQHSQLFPGMEDQDDDFLSPYAPMQRRAAVAYEED